MKTILCILNIALFTINLMAQPETLQKMLDNYLGLKDALVAGDGKMAAEKADLLLTTISNIEAAQLIGSEKKAFTANRDALLKSSQAIQKTADLEKQRTAFAKLSESLWQVVKVAESISLTLYYDYCPMKKAYWISAEEAIKNPYYGSKMLTCGSISEKKEK